jgi:chromosome partitioning protein
MIIVIGGIKGGSGKTTLATNLAVLAATQRKIILIDADEQRSAADWAEQREDVPSVINFPTITLGGKTIHSQINRMKPDYDTIIIDTGGRDTTSQRSALINADIFLIPFKPRSLDIWTAKKVNQMVTEIQSVNPKLKAYALINQADARGKDNVDALKIILEFPEFNPMPFQIGSRKAFANAAAEGLSVVELEKPDEKASQEITSLYNFIFEKKHDH